MDDDDWGIGTQQQGEKEVSEASDKPFEKATNEAVEEDSSSEGEKFINQNSFLVDLATKDIEQIVKDNVIYQTNNDIVKRSSAISESKDNQQKLQGQKESKKLSKDENEIQEIETINKGTINLETISKQGQQQQNIQGKKVQQGFKERFERNNTFQRKDRSPYYRKQNQFRNTRGNYQRNIRSQSRNRPVVPDRRRGRPQCSISIFSTRMSLTMKRIGQFKDSFLVLPYRTLKLETYPGSLIIQSKTNYRERLRQKNLKDGECCLQRVKDIAPITGVAFVKVGQERPEEDFLNGLEFVFIALRKIRQAVYSVIISWDQGLGDPLKALNKTAEQIQRFQHKGETLRDVYLNTVQPHHFSQLILAFERFSWSSFEEEGLWID